MEDDRSASGDRDRWDLIPASMLAAYAYCPRQCYLQWVEGDYAESAEKEDGRLQQRHVDEPVIPRDGSGPFQATAVFLSGPEIGITCRLDLLEGDGRKATPVEHKRGEVPKIPEGVYEPERVQLCAEGLVLREMGFDCDEGAVFYKRSSAKVPVVFDEALIRRTRELIADLRKVVSIGEVPPPLEESQKCNGCSLAGICLPDEVHLLKTMAAEEEALFRGETPLGTFCVESDDKIPIYVACQGHVVRKAGDRLEVWSKGEKVSEAKLTEISHVSLYGRVEITTPATVELMQRGIPVLHFSQGGWFHGICIGMSERGIELRRRQYEWAADASRSLSIARPMIAGKIRNCRAVLRRCESLSPPDILESLYSLSTDASNASSLESLRGIEGSAAKIYFSALGQMIKSDEADLAFPGRSKRPPLDPANAVLSYLYGILARDTHVALLATGFDPYMGLYHQPRFGRPSLALDLMEEFRPAIADQVALNLINNKELKGEDFMRTGFGVSISPQAKRKIIEGHERRIETEVEHPVNGNKVSYRRIFDFQARLLAKVISGEIAEYTAFCRR